MLTVSNLAKRFADRTVFEHVSFVVNPGDRIGLVGANGAGKTTLLAILAGDLEADAGAVALAQRTSLGYLRQGALDLPGGNLADLLDVPTGGLLAARAALDRASHD